MKKKQWLIFLVKKNWLIIIKLKLRHLFLDFLFISVKIILRNDNFKLKVKKKKVVQLERDLHKIKKQQKTKP